MTLIQRVNDAKPETMDGSPTQEDNGKSLRPIRSRRHTRRSMAAGHRPQKRLFTPEIKRYLKDWLVRRRDNPYPNREEKKRLSHETGLTYIQICNWFANWRRKLKNVNADKNQQTWGHLIRTYNDRAQGNVEQFSICSEDSIWSEPGRSFTDRDSDLFETSPEEATQSDDFDHSSSTDMYENVDNNNSYEPIESKPLSSPLLLSKWLESAARFQPSEANYSWWGEESRKKEIKTQKSQIQPRHDQDEVEAALALTVLATTNCLTAP